MSNWIINQSQPQVSQVTFYDPSTLQNGTNFHNVSTSLHNPVPNPGANDVGVMNHEAGELTAWNTYSELNQYGCVSAAHQLDSANNMAVINNQHWSDQSNTISTPCSLQAAPPYWDPNTQYHWDTQQPDPTHYTHQQPVNSNIDRYNNYWGGQNCNYDMSTNYQSENFNGLSDPSAVHYTPEFNYTDGQADAIVVTGQENISEPVTEVAADEVSFSTETESGSQSLNQSLGNENTSGMSGYEGNEDASDEDTGISGGVEGKDDKIYTEANNSQYGVLEDSTEYESEHHLQPVVVNNDLNSHMIHNSDDLVKQTSEVTNQMVSFNLEDKYVFKNNVVPANIVQVYSQVPAQNICQENNVVVHNSETDQLVKDVNSDHPAAFNEFENMHVNNDKVKHSRNASLDDNVHFFIGSSNSSTRVSPAVLSKAGDEPGNGVVCEHVDDVDHTNGDRKKYGKWTSKTDGSCPIEQNIKRDGNGVSDNNATKPPIAPPQISTLGGNPFRKTVKKENTSQKDMSMLSSTRLDVTRPDYANSPVLLNQSMSPILNSSPDKIHDWNNDDRTITQVYKQSDNVRDSPVSSNSNRAAVQQSPIMPRKENAFQPPIGQPMKTLPDLFAQEVKPMQVPTNAAGQSQKFKRHSNIGADDHIKKETIEKDGDKSLDNKMLNLFLDNQQKDGSKASEWNSQQRKRNSDDYSDSDRYSRDKNQYEMDKEKVTSRSLQGPSTSERGPSSRTSRSAFHHIKTSRVKNNISPATTLWDNADSIPQVSNILLVPTSTGVDSSLSQLKPITSLINALSEQIKSENCRIDEKDHSKIRTGNDNRERNIDVSKDIKDYKGSDRSNYNRDRDIDSRKGRDDYHDSVRGNKSYENLRDRNGKDCRNNSRERISMYSSRNSLDENDPRERNRRGDSRDRDRTYRDDYDRYRDYERPPSRGSTVDTRRDYKDRDSRQYRDYRRQDLYESPRYRQGEKERPSSRTGESDGPRSRAQYDMYLREKYGTARGYDYDEYYRQYYDRHYYDYYYGDRSYYNEIGYYRSDTTPRLSRTDTPGSVSDYGDEIAILAKKNKNHANKSEIERFDYPQDQLQSAPGYADFYSSYGYEQNGHIWDPDINDWVASTSAEVVPQRQTPEKFMIPHVRACFGPTGQLVKVLPSRPADGQPATVEIHDVHFMLEHITESEELQAFPGPLVRGDTHKNDVLLFCQKKAKDCAENMSLEDRDSAELIWRFLELLIKQNGTVVGTDIADLILRGHEPTTIEYRQTGIKIAASSDNLNDELDEQISRGATPVDRSFVNKAKSVEEITDRFRHLLLYGRKKDALDWAMKNCLWGHALFLASKMDSRAHASIMTRFANVAMRMNDPLQTLYQLMSGRQPCAVTSVAEDRWGDWRPHLAMILSNHTQKPELDRKSITTLGDTLASRGLLHASHFCYLMSHTAFGSYNKKSSKIVLIGSSHGLPLKDFTSNQAIQCTEIYEYALALSNSTYHLINFQTFKYLYATRLADYGFTQEALQYCEVISRSIISNPAVFQHVLVKLVYDLSCQLKYADPQHEESEDSQDPDWLTALHLILLHFEEGSIQPVSGTETPVYFGGRTTASSDSGEVGMYMQITDVGAPFQQQSFQYGSGLDNTLGTQFIPANTVLPAAIDTGQQLQHIANVTLLSQTSGDINPYQEPSQQTEGLYRQQQWSKNQVDSSYLNQQHVKPSSQSSNGYQNSQGYIQSYGTNQSVQHYIPSQPRTGFPSDVNLGDSQTSVESAKRSSLTSTLSFSQDDDIEDEEEDKVDSTTFPQPSIFDYHTGPQKIIPPKLRKRTLSETSTGSVDGDKQADNKSQQQQHKNMENDVIDNKIKPKQSAGGGLFAKIGGLFSRKNEMKLPDDKEPTIVWDPVKKKWVDKNADETDEALTAAPPPKDTEFSGASVPSSTSVPSFAVKPPGGSADPMAPSSLSTNKFSRRKGIGARSQYVDVLNPNPSATSHVSSALFPTLSSSHSAPAIFNPLDGPEDTLVDPVISKQDVIPEEKHETPNSNYTEHHTGNSYIPPLNENVNEGASSPSYSSDMPTMFNPSQFPSRHSLKQPAYRHRLTNRCVNPK